ncbi:hypothetical protein PVOR_21444 [Paenibacillus vortex V453]|uniref:Dihydroorotase n=1 Tax=Paenibacillus vortex V453 TaxID=715225 RepID=A0A2R9SRA2_9BACL|nr:hypothetical protein PVOR_21444 [Paenibacillus vortex V453]
MYLITGGKIITEEAILEGFDLLIAGNRIEKVVKQGEFNPDETIQVIDAEGGYISPGFS